MTSHYRHRRFYNPATVFPAVEPGEITVNSANRQLGLGDADPASPGVVKPLIAIRYFDIKAQYAINDMIGRTGHVWRAKVVISPGPFDPEQWELAAVDASYVDAGDADLQTQIDGKVNRSGDTMDGRLFLAYWPADDYEATTKGYVDQIVAQGGPFHLRADQITYAPSGSLESTDVQAAITELMTEKAEINSPNFVGNPTAPTRLSNDNDTSIATTEFANRAVDIGIAAIDFTPYAHKDSPIFTGDPQAPTPAPGDSDNSIATTSFVTNYYGNQAGTTLPAMDGVATVGTSLYFARDGHVHPTDTTRAPLDSPVFTGFPQAPTPGAGDYDNSIATTSFVQSTVGSAISAAIGSGLGYAVQYIGYNTAVYVPAGAHNCEVILVGAGGSSILATGGGGGVVMTVLTGLTPGLYVNLSIGAGGLWGAAGGASVLSSGSQGIGTLVAGGGGGYDAFGAGGTASGGQLNFPGGDAYTIGPFIVSLPLGEGDPPVSGSYYIGGTPALGFGAGAVTRESGKINYPTGYGAGGDDASAIAGGRDGLAIFRWFP